LESGNISGFPPVFFVEFLAKMHQGHRGPELLLGDKTPAAGGRPAPVSCPRIREKDILPDWHSQTEPGCVSVADTADLFAFVELDNSDRKGHNFYTLMHSNSAFFVTYIP